MKPIQIKNDLHIALPDYFDLEQIFTCGQNFRFDRKNDGSYCGVALGQVLRLKQQDNTLILYDTDEKAFEEIWMSYFALDIDYGTLRKQLDTDPPMRRALAYGYGIRILKQDLWEMIVTFLISQNNNIPRIKKIVTALCTAFGSPIVTEQEILYTFPTPRQLAFVTEIEFQSIGLGYRASYLTDAVRTVSGDDLFLQQLVSLTTCEAREKLMRIKGIGGKVADCILLFAMARYEVCPHDVWVKRIFENTYGITGITEKKGYALAEEKWGEYAGIAQQFLFHYERHRTDTNG